MRFVLTLALLATGCSFYAPSITDCTVACGEGGACPDGFACRGGWCRAASAQTDCQCAVGQKSACGSSVGACVQGEKTCVAGGTWSECVGEVKPSEEVCDGKDNDCDGLVDLGPVKLILDDNTGPFEAHWRMHASDAGYSVVTLLALPDGGSEARALRYDREFNPTGRSDIMVDGEWRRVESTMLGDTVYSSYYVGDDVRFSRILADGTVQHLSTLVDAGYDGRMQVGSGPRGVISSWLTLDSTVRVAKWSLDGGAPQVYDLPTIPNGTISYLGSTTDGRFSIIEADDLRDGGYIEAVQDNEQPLPFTIEAPYWSAQRFITRSNSTIAHVDIVPQDINSTSTDRQVVFWRNFGVQAVDGFFRVETPGRWHDSDFVLDTNEDVIAVYVDEDTQKFVFARIEGTSSTDQQVTRRIPADNVVVPVTATNGNVRVARVPGDPMFGLAWSTRKQVLARRFCAP